MPVRAIRPSNPDKQSPAHRQLHGRQRGKKLRFVQAELVDELLPRLGIARAIEPVDPRSLFETRFAKYVLEIGFGGGEHLVDEALANIDTGFIGCEPFLNGVAKLLIRVAEGDLRNVRVYNGNGLDILNRLPPASLDRVDLLYPDPWPKWRHRKRRFVSSESIALIARVVKPGGEFRFATDIDDYAGWTLRRVLATPDFQWRAASADDWRLPWPGYRSTRYEEKARREGRASSYLTFIRQ